MVVKEGDKMALLTAGYQLYKNLKPAIEDWLDIGFQELPAE